MLTACASAYLIYTLQWAKHQLPKTHVYNTNMSPDYSGSGYTNLTHMYDYYKCQPKSISMHLIIKTMFYKTNKNYVL